MRECSTLIIGVGNTLLRDEGLGMHALGRLEALDLGDEVALVRCVGDLITLEPVPGCRRMIIVDAIKGGAEPGTVHTIREPEFRSVELKPLSAHHLSAVESAVLLKRSNPEFQDAEIIFAGIEPADLSIGFGLSPRVEASMPLLIDEIVRLAEST